MNITVFHKVTGQILRTVQVPVGMANMQLSGHDEDWLEGTYSDDQFYVEGYTPIPMGPQPSPAHVFNYATKQWEDPRTLVDLKANKWSDIKQARDAQEFGTFFWDGSEFDCDQISQARIQGAVLSAVVANSMGVPYSVEWTLADNTKRMLSASEVIAMGIAFGQNTTASHEKARQLRVLIDQAQSKEELESITW